MLDSVTPSPSDQDIAAFIKRWQGSSGAERANKDLFLSELCDVLGVPRPDPVSGVAENDRYVFEKDAPNPREEGGSTTGKIDLFKDGCFILEAKQGSDAGTEKVGTAKRSSSTWWKAMQKAYVQGYQYAQAFDAPPPFLIVCDIGYCFDLYATFDGSWNYRHFPDAKRHRIFLADLPAHADTLRAIFTDPHQLDPSRNAAKVTRDIAAHLADLARGLEATGFKGQRMATFLMRCIFTMFAEDVGLLPAGLFVKALERDWIADPKRFPTEAVALWQTMNTGGTLFGVGKILRFNGGLFANPEAPSLTRKQLEKLLEAAKTDWVDVEPAIFGTLLERALDPKERHALGAHFTPRAYVERLVRATIEEPLRAEWDVTRAEAYHLIEAGKEAAARSAVRTFHKHLCEVRVLDPACGTGNFLYVTLDLMKRLESEVLGLLADLGETQAPLEIQGMTVTPAQFHGLEIKPWAKEIAELVLWIGYLQWQLRSKGDSGVIQEPVLQEYGNIECRDAVLAYDRREPVLDEKGKPVVRWDGETTKPSPVTGEPIPDESATMKAERYVNPRKAEWPEADYVVGNPPFIGSKLMRNALGDGYIDGLQEAWPEIPQASDFVLRWWHSAAVLAKRGAIRRFGFITTNSISQAYNRRVLEPHLDGTTPLSIVFAIPDHPWVDSAEGAAVRVAMTVGAPGSVAGTLRKVVRERDSLRDEGNEDLVEELSTQFGRIGPDLRIGPDVGGALALESNLTLCSVGMKTIGGGFQISEARARDLGLGCDPEASAVIRPYLNGRDLASSSRGIFVIDTFGMAEAEVRTRVPALYQHLVDHVRAERLQNRNSVFRQRWWIIGHPRPQFREFTAGLSRFIATIETSKHRFFVFLPTLTVPDSTLVTLGLDDGFHLGVLSSKLHTLWALAAGGRLGVGNDPRYNKTRCFETFPFPSPTPAQFARIGDLGETLDSHRKRQQSLHPSLTITGMYNVLGKLRSGEALTAKEKVIHEQGLVSVLKQIHDELDAAVFDAYGWPSMLTDEEILERLVALNAVRAEEEKRGIVRWLRPEFQNPGGTKTASQGSLPTADEDEHGNTAPVERPQPWPTTLPLRIGAVRDLLRQGGAPTFAMIRTSFAGAKPKELQGILDSLAALGLAVSHEEPDGRKWTAGGRSAGGDSIG